MTSICLVIAVVIAATLQSRGQPDLQNVRPALGVVVAPSAAPVALPSPLAVPYSRTVETAADAAAIGPYRTAVRKALGLEATALFHDVVVASPVQHIVCGAVSERANGGYRSFVYIGNASIAALDDGSPDFKEMRKGACTTPRP